MAYASAPIERVPGRSRFGYWAGYMIGSVHILVGFAALLWSSTGSLGWYVNPRDTLLYNSLYQLMFLTVFLFWTVWLLLIPLPLGTIEISPIGVRIDSGLWSEQFPWSGVHRAGNRLYTFGRILGLPRRFAMSDYQTSRVRLFLPD